MKKLILIALILCVPAIAFAADPSLSGTDVDLATKLWKSGAWIQLGSLALYAALVVAGKLDKKRAFYWTAGASAAVVIIDSIRVGGTPTLSMVVAAVTGFVALAMKGPEKAPTTEAAK